MSRLIEVHQLLDLSALEQDLACTSNHDTHLKKVVEKLRDVNRVSNIDALRLVLLYALRYETRANELSKLRKLLHDRQVGDVDKVDQVLNYAGTSQRGGDLFGDKDILSNSFNIVQRKIKVC